MMRTLPHYFGYRTTSFWREAINGQRVVYATPITEIDYITYGEIKRQFIVLAQPDEDGHLHYVRIPICQIRTIDHKPFGEEQQKKKPLLGQSWEIVLQWLKQQQLTIRQATPAIPKTHNLLDGIAEFLRFNKEKYRYEKIEP